MRGADWIRVVIFIEEAIVIALYIGTTVALVTSQRTTAELRTGRLALCIAIVLLMSLSIYDEIDIFGQRLEFRDALQQAAAISLVVAWWKLIGVRFEHVPDEQPPRKSNGSRRTPAAKT
jgi:F420-0:gamma-glutamyl ligase